MNSGISKYFLLELLAQFSSDFNSSRKRYEEEYKREHVIGMDIHLKTYKAILKELDFTNFINYTIFIFALDFFEIFSIKLLKVLCNFLKYLMKS